MPGPISSDCSPLSPVNCRWAELAKREEKSESNLIDLPREEQVARGKELLSMLQDVPFPIGDHSANLPSIPQEVLPPPPVERPPPPPGFEVGGFSEAGPHRDWLPPSAPPAVQFPARPSGATPAVPPPPPPSGGPTGGPAAGGAQVWGGPLPSAWPTLSTNPSGMNGNYQDNNGAAHVHQNQPSAGAAAGGSGPSNGRMPPPTNYSMPPPTNSENRGDRKGYLLGFASESPQSSPPGLWSAPAGTPPAPSPGLQQVGASGQFGAPPQSLQASAATMLQFAGQNGLRAEAAPFQPMGNMSMGVGVPAC